MSIQPGVSFVSQLFLLDDDAQPLPQSAPYPKMTVRRISGTPANIFVSQTMSGDGVGQFYYSWTPPIIGQYKATFEYLLDGIPRFFTDDIDVETGSGSSGSSTNADINVIVETDDDEIVVDATSDIVVTDSNMEAIVVVEEC